MLLECWLLVSHVPTSTRVLNCGVGLFVRRALLPATKHASMSHPVPTRAWSSYLVTRPPPPHKTTQQTPRSRTMTTSVGQVRARRVQSFRPRRRAPTSASHTACTYLHCGLDADLPHSHTQVRVHRNELGPHEPIIQSAASKVHHAVIPRRSARARTHAPDPAPTTERPAPASLRVATVEASALTKAIVHHPFPHSHLTTTRPRRRTRVRYAPSGRCATLS